MRLLVLLSLVFCQALMAADLPAPTAPPAPTLADARQAIKAKDWKAAESALRAVLKDQPRHADALNLLGFTLRWQERYDESLAAYQQAFAVEPDHQGAHEYIARTYLKLGRVADAERHLARLRQLCADCAEAKALDKAVAEARKP